MAKKFLEVMQYFENLYRNKAVYLWGANGEPITPSLCNKLYKTYGNSTYNKTYYDNKLNEGLGRIGADCSGAMFPVSGFDATAQNYYSKCSENGIISSLPHNKPCLVFKGSSDSAINHVGFYCGNGYVIEMKSSKENCVKAVLDGNGWKWYGIPTWIDYSSSNTSTTTQLKCIDVSAYQGNINWKQVKSSGIDFAILRGVTKNGNMDTTFETNYQNASSSGVNVMGVYHFSYALNEITSKKDAENMIGKLNGKKLDIYLDLEWASQGLLGKSKVTSIAKSYISTCKLLGYTCHIYSNLDWYKNKYNASELSALGCKFWIARYSASDTGTVKDSLKPNIGEYIWQYSSKGSVPGITGNVDINIIYDYEPSNNGNTNITPPSSNSPAENSLSLLGKITTTSSNLTIRSQPNTNATVLGSYSKSSIVQLVAKTLNGWYRTDKGYISGAYVSAAIGKAYNCKELNFRTSYNSDIITNIIKTLKPGEEMTLLKEENGWYQSRLNNGTVGWVSKKYIRII